MAEVLTGPEQPSTASRRRVLGWQVGSFAVIGVINTLAYVVLFNAMLAAGTGSLVANAAALVVTVASGFWLNRRVTFRRAGRHDLLAELGRFVASYMGTAAVSSAALWLLLWWRPEPGALLENIVGVGSNAGLMVVRFALLRGWVFRGHDVGPDVSRHPRHR